MRGEVERGEEGRMSGRIRLDRGELPWAPLVPGGGGLNRLPQEPVALRGRMADLWCVRNDQILPVPGSRFAIEHIGKSLDLKVYSPDFGFDECFIPEKLLDRLDEAIVFDLDGVYGLAGAPCGGIVAHARIIETLERAFDWSRLPTPTVRLAEAALHPSRMLATQARADVLKAEHRRMCEALGLNTKPRRIVWLPNADRASFERFGLQVRWESDGTAVVAIGTPEQNDLVLAAMGVAVPPRAPVRRAEVARDTKETRIVATVDLGRTAPIHIATGIGFYDHMLEQVARHGGFSLTLAAEGDLHIEAHHTIEDCALALGQALREALGDRKGVARFGFVAPLDEAEAAVTLDLSGRPFVRFEGEFKRATIGEYPTEMTAHVFRSLADAMRATIHVKVTGDDDHHKTEAAFKSFGRALRQAIRVEGEGIPSTKGVLA